MNFIDNCSMQTISATKASQNFAAMLDQLNANRCGFSAMSGMLPC